MRETEEDRWQLGVTKFSLKVDGFQTQLKENFLKTSFGAVERKEETLNPLQGCCVLQNIFFSFLFGKREKKLYVEPVVLSHNSDFCSYRLAKQMCSK